MDSHRAITKEIFLQAVACKGWGWFLRNRGRDEPPRPGELLRMEEGQEVHRRARGLFPKGIFAGTLDRTAAALVDGCEEVIFEAAFSCDGYAARADGLQRTKRGFRLIEVKSSLFNEDGPSPEHIDDLAYTAMVLTRSGLRIDKTVLLLLSRGWRLGMTDADLFVAVECTEDVLARVAEFAPMWDDIRTAVRGHGCPPVSAQKQCGDCPYFEGDCVGKGIEAPIFQLPRLSEKRCRELVDGGSLSIHEIPASIRLTPTQERVRTAVTTGRPVVNPNVLATVLATVRWPAHYLDFETVKLAIPVWKDVAPHEQVVTQYSLHRCDSPGKVVNHTEYLAEPDRDCRRELAERLLQEAAGNGSIVVYSSFEKFVINGLAKRFPDLAVPLTSMTGRLFDLERVFREGYCHPGFGGRTSIKATLPVMIKGMRYDDLDIGDGDTAVAAFAKMARGQASSDEAKRIRKALCEYCRQDTLAMVKLHEAVTRLAK